MKRSVKVHLITGIIKKLEFDLHTQNEFYDIFYCDKIEGTETFYKKSYHFPINSIVFMVYITTPEKDDIVQFQEEELNEIKEVEEKEKNNKIFS